MKITMAGWRERKPEEPKTKLLRVVYTVEYEVTPIELDEALDEAHTALTGYGNVCSQIVFDPK